MPNDTINDDLFGNLTWNTERHEWHGRGVTTRGLAFDLWIDTGAWDMAPPIDDAKVTRAISAASRQAFIHVRDSEEQAREGLIAESVPGEQMALPDLRTRLQLDNVHILSDGGVEIFYGDDGIFGGHGFVANLDPSGVFTHGEMFG
jgi:hypothetical protein